MELIADNKTVSDIKNWFTGYISTFKYDDLSLQQNIDLKEVHTRRVCKEIISIGSQLGLNDNKLRLAEVIALLHDIGRFEQFSSYRTFNDQKSEDHADLGINILKQHKVLDQFNDPTKELILCSIKHHNKPSISPIEDLSSLFYSRLIRDADKLDILKVITEYYHRKNGKQNGAIELNLPDTSGFSTEVYQSIMQGEIVNMKDVRNLNDFKLLQIAWVFDINFQPTLTCIKNRRYIEMIFDVLPKSPKIKEIFNLVSSTLSSTLS